jgi:hypothetical protein
MKNMPGLNAILAYKDQLKTLILTHMLITNLSLPLGQIKGAKTDHSLTSSKTYLIPQFGMNVSLKVIFIKLQIKTIIF